MTKKDRERLRQLARWQLEIANSPDMLQCVNDWKALNGFRARRPMLRLYFPQFENDVMPQRMECEGETARRLEAELLRNILPHTIYHDDAVVPGHFDVRWQTWLHLFGHNISVEHSTDQDGREVGHRYQYVLGDLEEDAEKLGPTSFGVHREATQAHRALCEDVFGDILPVRCVMPCLYALPTMRVVQMMGMEAMMFNMMDHPERFKAMMERIADDYTAFFRMLEGEGLLNPTTGGQELRQGSYAFTEELPGPEALAGQTVTTRDVWGFMDSQESVGISPEMFGEFIFPFYERLAGEFGLLSYGCCEPVDPIWGQYLSRFPHLRKVSISAWCNEEIMGEQLRGRNVVYHRKPSPNYLGVGFSLDEDAFRQYIKKTLHAAQGCTLEFTQGDVYTISHNEAKLRRYVQIVQECIAEDWQG